MRARRLLLPAACLGALTVSACTGSSSGGAPTSASASATTSAATSASPSPSPSVTAFTSTCADGLALVDVSRATGQPIIGTTSFVVGVPDASIGRLANLNCRYGLPEPKPGAPATTQAVPGVEIGLSLYDTAARAAARVEGTVEDYRDSGSRAEPVPVGSASGTMLIGGGPQTLVVAQGPRTVAVSIAPKLLTGTAQLVAVAELALAVK